MTTENQPQPMELTPQALINLRWADWLARKHPGFKWRIVRDDEHTDGSEREAG